MKKQIITAFLLIFGLFTLGSGVLLYNIYSTSNNLRYLVELHEIEEVRHDLFYNVQKVQSYVHAPGMVFSKHLDEIITAATKLDESINRCHNCHHLPDIKSEINSTQQLVNSFEEQLSYLITMVADTDRRKNMQDKVYGVGNKILTEIQSMIRRAKATAQRKSEESLEQLYRVFPLLGGTLVITFLLALLVARTLTKMITQPIDALVKASRKISDGMWGYQTDFKATGEFAELVNSFNNMSTSLSAKNKQNQQQMVDLKNTQAQLVEAEKLTAVGTLAGGIAHDFNNILCGMLGQLNNLRSYVEPNNENQEIITTIESAGFRAADLIKQLLAFARKKSIHKKAVDINQCVTDVINLIKNSISKKIAIKISLSDRVPFVFGDPAQLEQVIMNLCINARDALPDGGSISINTKHLVIDERFCAIHSNAQPGNYINIEISDTGLGIDKNNLRRIFEPFFTTKEVGKGTGLGLAMVYGTVKSHGGLCLVDSIVGQGTTFKLFLPASDKEIIAPDETVDKPTESMSATILIVDDEKIISSMMVAFLHEHGFETLLATNGQEAVDKVKGQKDNIDLVILDINMPIMDGREAFNKFIEIKPNIKVLISTGSIGSSEAQEMILKGAKGLIQKPFKMDDLITEINRIMKSQ